MRNSALGILTAALVAVAGCGGGTSPVIERNDPGTGSSTLQVQADIDANDVVGGFITDFQVDVRDGAGNPVSGATVTIRNNDLGTVTLLESSAGSGDYVATRNSFPSGDFELSVVRGTDKVEGVVLGGPGVHTITAPVADETHVALQDLIVTWTAPLQARSAEVETFSYTSPVLADNGTFTIPAIENEARADQRIRVFRFNDVDIAGGLPGSRLRVEVRQTIEPVIIE